MIARSLFRLAKNMCKKCTHIFAVSPQKCPAKARFSGVFNPGRHRKFRRRIKKRRVLTPIKEESISEYPDADNLIPTANGNISASLQMAMNGLLRRCPRYDFLGSRTAKLGRFLSTYRSYLLKYFFSMIRGDAKRKRPRRQADYISLLQSDNVSFVLLST